MVKRKNVCKNSSLTVIYWIQQEHVQQFKLKKLKAWSYSGPFLQHHSLCAAVATVFLTSCECSIHSNELWQIIPDLWLWTSLFHSQKQEKKPRQRHPECFSSDSKWKSRFVDSDGYLILQRHSHIFCFMTAGNRSRVSAVHCHWHSCMFWVMKASAL